MSCGLLHPGELAVWYPHRVLALVKRPTMTAGPKCPFSSELQGSSENYIQTPVPRLCSYLPLSLSEDLLGGYDHALYVEKWAPFVKELAVIVARGRDNSIPCYPVVETIHRENICHIVKAPANVPWKIRKLATDVAYKAVSSLEGAGIFAVELFLTGDGQILLNEVAPRPHNSGHHTIEYCFTSQFEQHLRAVVGLPLGRTRFPSGSSTDWTGIRRNVKAAKDGSYNYSWPFYGHWGNRAKINA
ncbi:hypothetical protein LOK49_LG07G03418 [Camellia lanceoleosa]|uniref:Uncharacterized protein n=1 Tax=Camellia lanceoleosa TaxID=1840588 RepID=A0ACC0H2Q2_9ERIC|nr:hypothetical protein LOK49_LG07G03418 [Camellia lanceoleosa]